mmetsp:Transcript_5359/g.21229  ORF Transcript_5359/g.21229 Transcript_5359/m.21229 type:complete len:238 (+) Transcript_5359:816-1529(+)|eukprot:scaffold1355_cov268-Pinguiococcus_pyrenoidosus.AAC.46
MRLAHRPDGDRGFLQQVIDNHNRSKEMHQQIRRRDDRVAISALVRREGLQEDKAAVDCFISSLASNKAAEGKASVLGGSKNRAVPSIDAPSDFIEDWPAEVRRSFGPDSIVLCTSKQDRKIARLTRFQAREHHLFLWKASHDFNFNVHAVPKAKRRPNNDDLSTVNHVELPDDRVHVGGRSLLNVVPESPTESKTQSFDCVISFDRQIQGRQVIEIPAKTKALSLRHPEVDRQRRRF